MSKLRKGTKMPRYFLLPDPIQVVELATGNPIKIEGEDGKLSVDKPWSMLTAFERMVFGSNFMPPGRKGARVALSLRRAVKAAEALKKDGRLPIVCIDKSDWEALKKVLDDATDLKWNHNISLQLEPFWACFDEANAPEDVAKLPGYSAAPTPPTPSPAAPAVSLANIDPELLKDPAIAGAMAKLKELQDSKAAATAAAAG